MAQDGWGAPRNHAELTKLGFIVSEVTVSGYMPRWPAEPDQVKRWVAFLRNHKDDIAAMDLFTVPTVSLRLLYGFFAVSSGARRLARSRDRSCFPIIKRAADVTAALSRGRRPCFLRRDRGARACSFRAD